MRDLTVGELQHKLETINRAKYNLKEIRLILDELEKAVDEEREKACLATDTLGEYMNTKWQEETDAYFQSFRNEVN